MTGTEFRISYRPEADPSVLLSAGLPLNVARVCNIEQRVQGFRVVLSTHDRPAPISEGEGSS